VAEDHAPVRGLVFGTIVCAASWLLFAEGAGNVGLQRAVSRGPALLLWEHPMAVPLLLGTAFLVSYSLVRWLLPRVTAIHAAAWVLAGDLFGSIVLAPVLVGELEPVNAPIVFATISFFGLQIAAAASGAWLATRIRTSAPAI